MKISNLQMRYSGMAPVLRGENPAIKLAPFPKNNMTFKDVCRKAAEIARQTGGWASNETEILFREVILPAYKANELPESEATAVVRLFSNASAVAQRMRKAGIIPESPRKRGGSSKELFEE